MKRRGNLFLIFILLLICFFVENVNAMPQIQFITAPVNNATLNTTSVLINVSVSDTFDTSAWIDWNRSLVGWWNFESVLSNGTVYDNSSYGNSGTTSGFSLNTTVLGARGNAMQFNTTTERVVITNESNLDFERTSSFTISAWVYLNSLGSQRNIWTKHLSSQHGIEFNIRADNSLALVLGNNFYGGYTSYSTSASSSNTISANAWHYLAATYNGSQNAAGIQVYIDGVKMLMYNGTDAMNGSILNNDTPLIGNGISNINFNGSIDEVMIWSRALSPQEINASYNASLYSLYNNFVNLTSGNYTYKAQVINSNGNVNSTELRNLSINLPKSQVQISDTGMIGANQTANFYANYTNSTSGISINGTGVSCNIYFNDSNALMSFNQTSSLYQYNRTFGTAGIYSYYVSCDGTTWGYELLNSSSNQIQIIYYISFVNPTPSNASITNKVAINVSIMGVSNLSAINFNWNGTNYTAFNNSLIMMMNFENFSALGENNSLVADLSNNWNNATCTSTACPKWNSTGRYGGAFNYDGINDRFLINKTTATAVNMTEITVEAWVYMNDLGVNNYPPFVSNWNVYSSNKGFLLRMERDSPTYIYFALWFGNGTTTETTATLVFNDSYFSSQYQQKWIQIVTTFKAGQDKRIYINGQLARNQSSTLNYILLDNLTYLGYSGVNSGYFNGSIDSVRIWNRSLNQAEVQQEYLTNLNKYDANNWNLYINQSFNQSLTNGNYTYYASVKDNVGNENFTDTRIVDFDSITSYSNFLNNYGLYIGQAPRYGNLTTFNISLSDATGLAGYTTGCDFTGNDSYVPISGTSYNLNFIKTANLSEESTGCCYVWFNDTVGNSNQTSNSCFNMKTRTKININYNILDHPISNLIFGEGLYGNTWQMRRIFTSAGYNTTYLPTAQTVGFTNLRFNTGGSEYDWNLYANNISSDSNYRRWRNYSIYLTGQEPTLVLQVQDPYNLTKAIAWVNDSVQQGFNITNWEIGNELYLGALCNGTQNATCFALRIKEVCAAIKQVKPDARCGLVLSSYSDSGLYGYGSTENWNDKLLGIAGNYTDFVIVHEYSPNSYFDVKSWWSTSPATYNFNVNGNTNYSIRANAETQACCENTTSDCYPDLQIKVDGIQVLLMNVTNNVTGSYGAYGIYNTSYNLNLSAGAHNITIDEKDQYQNASSGCKKAIFLANLSVSNITETVPVSLWDVRNWTYSMYATQDTVMIKNLQNISSNIIRLTNHSMDIKLTEYNFQYCPAGACFSSPVWTQYGWRGDLFTALDLNTWLQQNISQANLWSDPTTYSSGGDNWRYVSEDGMVKYPPYYIINLFSSKTGNYYVNFTTQDLTTYNDSTIADSTMSPNVSNEPFLSISPSKDTKNNKYDLAIVNRNQDDDELVQINISDNNIILNNTAYVTVLSGTNLSSHPYLDGVNIAPSSYSMSSAQIFNYTIPRFSVVFFEVGYTNLTSNSALVEGYPSFKPTQQQVQQGYETSLQKNWQIQFSFNNENYTIKLDEIINNTTIITLSSGPITFNLSLNETKKFDLNGDGYYDLQIFLNSISKSNADLIVQTIHEQIPAEGITGAVSGTETNQENKNEIQTIIYVGIVVGVIVILFFIIRKNLSKKKRKDEKI